jgi:hypothetical protein
VELVLERLERASCDRQEEVRKVGSKYPAEPLDLTAKSAVDPSHLPHPAMLERVV